MIRLVLSAAFAATALTAASAAAQTAPYRAAGTEPFWGLTIDAKAMRLERPGVAPVVVAAPVPRPSFNGLRYVTPVMTVDVTRAPCSDGTSDRKYRDTVTVTLRRQTLRGCGNPEDAPVVASRLEGKRWSIAAIDRKRVRIDRPTSLRFDGSRISGQAGCNRFNSTYRLAGAMLRVGGVVATRMACPGAAMQVENRVFALLAQPLRARWIGARTVVLTGRRGSVTLVAAP